MNVDASAMLDAWFTDQGWQPFPFQHETWQAYMAGKSGLVHAPTGLGKTYAVLGGPLSEAMAADRVASGLTVLWLTPLKALAGDTTDAIRRIIEGLEVPWSVEIRHGDTSAYRKRKQRDAFPAVLVTTPESLSLLLSYPAMRKKFSSLQCVVVDEWHELLATKRGTQVELALARLRKWNSELRVWGLSATLSNIEDAKSALLGSEYGSGVIVEGCVDKRIEIVTLLPDAIETFPWSGHLGDKLADKVIAQIEQCNTTLVFTNTRNQAEVWYQRLLQLRPDWMDTLGLHHGSIDKEQRAAIEAGLDTGALRAVVCTSSLDLGVDFTPVEQVIQVGSPKGIARLMQRAGRSGHQPGATSRIYGVPTNALEIVEFAAARDALERKEIESRKPLQKPIDVLVQHLVTVALGNEARLDALHAEVKMTHAYRDLSDLEWAWAVDFVTRGGEALQAYPGYRKVEIGDDAQALSVPSTQVGRLHRMSIGTITSNSEVLVKFSHGRTLGAVEENFISRLKPGDTFQFAGKRLQLVRLRAMVAQVKLAKSGHGVTPAWAGGRSPLSSELSHAVSRRLATPTIDSPEMEKVAPILEIQNHVSQLPHQGHVLVELTSVQRHTLMTIYPFAGRSVHEGLAALFAYRLVQQLPLTVKTSINDYGIALHMNQGIMIDAALVKTLLQTEAITDDLIACMNTSELARRQFREISRVAGLLIQGYPGKSKSTRQLQVSSGLLFDVFLKYDPKNMLLTQASREIFERQLDSTRLVAAMRRMQAAPLSIISTASLTPMAFPLWAEQLQTQVSSESWTTRVQTLAKALEEEVASREQIGVSSQL